MTRLSLLAVCFTLASCSEPKKSNDDAQRELESRCKWQLAEVNGQPGAIQNDCLLSKGEKLICTEPGFSASLIDDGRAVRCLDASGVVSLAIDNRLNSSTPNVCTAAESGKWFQVKTDGEIYHMSCNGSFLNKFEQIGCAEGFSFRTKSSPSSAIEIATCENDAGLLSLSVTWPTALAEPRLTCESSENGRYRIAEYNGFEFAALCVNGVYERMAAQQCGESQRPAISEDRKSATCVAK